MGEIALAVSGCGESNGFRAANGANQYRGDPTAFIATGYGVRDFAWDRSKGEMTYEIRGRKASDPARTYSFSKTTSKTRLRAGGFESGVEYTFEIRAYGAKEMESPWCDPFTKNPA